MNVCYGMVDPLRVCDSFFFLNLELVYFMLMLYMNFFNFNIFSVQPVPNLRSDLSQHHFSISSFACFLIHLAVPLMNINMLSLMG